MLIECRECGSRVSDEAQSCPHCGCRGPSGEYSYVQDGIECTVNENGFEKCAKCGQDTKHRIIDSYWEIPGRGHVIGKKKICKVCGSAHLWRSDWEQQRREKEYAEAAARSKEESATPVSQSLIKVLLWLGGIVLPLVLIFQLWESVDVEIRRYLFATYFIILFGTIGWKIGQHKRFSTFGLIMSVLLCAILHVLGVIIVAYVPKRSTN